MSHYSPLSNPSTTWIFFLTHTPQEYTEIWRTYALYGVIKRWATSHFFNSHCVCVSILHFFFWGFVWFAIFVKLFYPHFILGFFRNALLLFIQGIFWVFCSFISITTNNFQFFFVKLIVIYIYCDMIFIILASLNH